MRGGSWHQIKKNNHRNLNFEKSYKKQQKACALFHDDTPQVMYTNKKKYLGVFTEQAYTVVYATVKYLLYHLYIENKSRHRKKHYNK